MSPGAPRGPDGIHIALLRGINLGSRHRIAMDELAEIFHAAGCTEVRTYIQSGNVVFRADEALAGRIPGLVTEAIVGRTGLRVPVVTRSAAEFEAVAAGNPFPAEGEGAGKILHVGFLREEPDPARVASLEPDRSPPDEFVVRGREIYLRCPNGVARSRLTTGYFDSRLGTTTTLRNWRTVGKVLALVRSALGADG